MNGLAAYLLVLTLSPILVLLVQASAIRLQRTRDSSPQLVVGFSILIGYVLVAFFTWIFYLRHLSSYECFWAALYGFIVYTCLSYSYFHFFNISETARRFQILFLLRNGHKIYRQDLTVRYNAANMIKTRLDRLIQSGQLAYENNRYFLKRRTLCYVAQILMKWAVLLRFKQSS